MVLFAPLEMQLKKKVILFKKTLDNLNKRCYNKGTKERKETGNAETERLGLVPLAEQECHQI